MVAMRTRLILFAAMVAVGASVFCWFAEVHVWSTRRVSKLEESIAGMPLGISADEADAIVGSAPDAVTQQQGVLVTPRTMYDVSNPNAAKYGQPRIYSMRIWERDGVRAAVAIDAEAKVVGRWSW